MARSVSDNLHFNEGQDDYLDLEQLNDDNYKKILLEFNLGYSEKGIWICVIDVMVWMQQIILFQ